MTFVINDLSHNDHICDQFSLICEGMNQFVYNLLSLFSRLELSHRFSSSVP